MRPAAFSLILVLVVAACGSIPVPTPPTGSGSPSATLPAGLPNVPADPLAAARFLAEAALDPQTGEAAVLEILTRSGIPVRAAATGRVLNAPAQPTLVDSYVYDFELEFIARAIAEDRTWAVADLSGLVAALGGTVAGAPIPTDLLDKAVADWVAAGLADPADQASFPALATVALAQARTGEAGSAPSSPIPDIVDFDPLQFSLAAASLLSRTGRFESAAVPGGLAVANLGLIVPLEVAAGPCDQAKQNVSLDTTGLAKKALKDYATEEVGAALGDSAKSALKDFLKAVDLTGDGLTLALLLAGLDLFVSDDTNSAAHYRHREPAPKTYRYVAAVSMQSPFPDELIPCLGLAGVKLPPNGPLQGWLVQWQIQEDGDHVRALDKTEAQKLAGAGGAAGELTGPDGLSTLTVELRWEIGCPTRPECGQGRGRAGEATGVAQLAPDPNSLPIKISDLFNLPKAAGKLLIDMLKNMNLPSAHHKVNISWHEPRFELVFDSTVRIHSSGLPDSGGHLKATVKLDSDFEKGITDLAGVAPLQVDQIGTDLTANCPIKERPQTTPGNFTVISAKPVPRGDPAKLFPVTPDFQDLVLDYTVNPTQTCPSYSGTTWIDWAFLLSQFTSSADYTGSVGQDQSEFMVSDFSANGVTMTKRIHRVFANGSLGSTTEDTTITMQPIL